MERLVGGGCMGPEKHAVKATTRTGPAHDSALCGLACDGAHGLEGVCEFSHPAQRRMLWSGRLRAACLLSRFCCRGGPCATTAITSLVVVSVKPFGNEHSHLSEQSEPTASAVARWYYG